MAHIKSILTLSLLLLLGISHAPSFAMEEGPPAPDQKTHIEPTLQEWRKAQQIAQETLQIAEEVLSAEEENPQHPPAAAPLVLLTEGSTASAVGEISYSPSPEPVAAMAMPAAQAHQPGLAQALDDYFAQEQIDVDFLGAGTAVGHPANSQLPGSPAIPHRLGALSPAPANIVQQEGVANDRSDGQIPFLSDDLGALTAQIRNPEPAPGPAAAVVPLVAVNPQQPVAQPIAANPGLPNLHAMPNKPAPQKIDESFLADILKNIPEAKGPMITAGTLGLVHYLYENQVFNQAIGVRSPKMKEYLHKYILPTAREALAAHLIQLLLPYLPYLNTQDIRSYSTGNYLGCYVTTKVLGVTALYLAKLVTKTEQGKKLVTHYKRLPKKTKETIEKVVPWLDFIRNMFMARSLAAYFEPAVPLA